MNVKCFPEDVSDPKMVLNQGLQCLKSFFQSPDSDCSLTLKSYLGF